MSVYETDTGPRFPDYVSHGPDKETFYQRQINEQDEDHINDEFLDRAPADYADFQTDSKPPTYLDDDTNYNGQIDDYKSEGFNEAPARSSGRYPRSLRKNSDLMIKEKVSEVLTKDKDIDASDIEIIVNQGTVVLSGTVENRDERFRVEMAIESINGVEDIINNLKLRKYKSRSKQ